LPFSSSRKIFTSFFYNFIFGEEPLGQFLNSAISALV
jgi:hypothetical protein